MKDMLDSVEVSGSGSMHKLKNDMYCVSMSGRVIVKYYNAPIILL